MCSVQCTVTFPLSNTISRNVTFALRILYRLRFFPSSSLPCECLITFWKVKFSICLNEK